MIAGVETQTSGQRFRNFFRAAPVGVYLYQLQPDGRLVLVDSNPAADRITGINNQKIIGKTIEEIFPLITTTELPERYRLAASNGVPYQTRHFSYIDDRIDGVFEIDAFQTAPNEVAIVFRDITEDQKNEAERLESHRRMQDALDREKQAVAQLESVIRELKVASEAAEAATRAKSVFLANMSHEIRTPMTAILGYTESLLEPELSPSESLNAIHTIRRNGEHLLTLINDILDLSKIEAGKMTLEQITCSPCRLVAEVASLVGARAEAKQLAFGVEYAGPVPELIRTDPTRLRQILINLVGNAVKFTEEGGVRLIVKFLPGKSPSADKEGRDAQAESAESKKAYIEFDVVDTGVGLTPDQMQHLFQPFVQADASTSRKFGGTGLGLAISKYFAEMLGGKLSIVDTQAGVGTHFRVTVATGPMEGIRLIDDPARATTMLPDPIRHQQPTIQLSCRILLAEDGPDNQRLIKHILTKAGAEVVIVDNGQIAVTTVLAALKQGRPFDVVLMDMQMPVMDGYEATGLLRQKGYEGPIIALTAYAMATDSQRCINAGCTDYAAKPIDRAKLLELIRRHTLKKPTLAVTVSAS